MVALAAVLCAWVIASCAWGLDNPHGWPLWTLWIAGGLVSAALWLAVVEVRHPWSGRPSWAASANCREPLNASELIEGAK